MSTNASFNNMLKRYMPYKLLTERMKKRNYFWQRITKKEDWKGGVFEVPFEASEASSLSFGELVASNDIAESSNVMGLISAQPELWGAMKFNEKDLDRHTGDLEASYLAVAPTKISQFVDRMAERISIMLLNDGSLAKLTADGANGSITVDHPERFTLGEKLIIKDDDSSVTGYITGINRDTKVLTIKNARSGGSAVDCTGVTTAANGKVYIPNGTTSGFTSLSSQLLSVSNGGSAALFGETKTAYPFLQAQNIDGSSFSASNVLESVYDAFFDTSTLGIGEQKEVWMSFKHFKNIAKKLEISRQFKGGETAGGYGWKSIELVGNDGGMKVVGLRDMPDDKMHMLDLEGIKFHGDKFFERKRHLNGDEFFLVRNQTGYEYIVDIKFYGDLVVHNPSHQAIIHGINY